jgi:phosphoserine aminotransferase
MSKLVFLTPGPSELYFTVPDHLQQALRENIGSISHRSSIFEQIFAQAVGQLRQLMNIPPHFHIVFTASATEVWERIIQNLTSQATYHLVNGSFSKKFYETAQAYKRAAVKHEVEEGEGFRIEELSIPDAAELIGLTLNETSTGVVMPLEQIYSLRKQHPDKLIAVDAVSIAPYPNLDFNQIDSLFFSVQKCFGLPAGLGVWIFNDRCLRKAEELERMGHQVGSYHTISAYVKNAAKNQTPETPNVLGIYLLGKVAEDMNRRGMQAIRQEINYKSSLMYHTLAANPSFEIFVKEKEFRSPTIVVANTLKGKGKDFMAEARRHGIEVGGGYGKMAEKQIRIANFPTHSKEVFEKLADILAAY